MTPLTKNRILLVTLVLTALSVVPSLAEARYKHKLSILPLEDSPGWVALYSAGRLVSEKLKRFLAGNDGFHVVPAPRKNGMATGNGGNLSKISEKTKKAVKNSRAGMRHPAQILVKGRVLEFSPQKVPSTPKKKKESAKPPKKFAEVRIELELVNHHTGRRIARKEITARSDEGTVPFEVVEGYVDIDAAGFRNSSMGLALDRLGEEAAGFLDQTLSSHPLDGEIISVKEKAERILINLGWSDGVKIRDLFTVFSVTLGYMDPLNHRDLGDRFHQKGVVKVENVQEGFSRAVILTGSEFAAGDLVRSRPAEPVSLLLETSAKK